MIKLYRFQTFNAVFGIETDENGVVAVQNPDEMKLLIKLELAKERVL